MIILLNPFVSFPASVGFSPDSISNLDLWMDASDGDSLTIDGFGKVTTWADRSTNTHSATGNSTGSSSPSVVSVGGINMIDCDPGTQAHFTIPDHATLNPGTAQFTIFVVYRKRGDTARGAFIYKEGPDAAGDLPGYEVFIRHVAPPSNGQLGVAFGDSEDLVFDGATDRNFADDTKRGAVVVRDSGGDYPHYEILAAGKSAVDSSPLEGTVVGDVDHTNQLYLGSRRPGSSNQSFLDGDLGEILFYNKALTDGEINQVQDYLASKWGL